ncbi:MAG: hypothetical protein EOO01_10865 [Chitinophagaceae bacterium]|nr:MAG: hypothetical protein EOO01_10865 [Chitinophagaceae bacterium]
MPSARSTTKRLNTLLFIFTFFIVSVSHAQDNSPFSRYGLGDRVPQENIVNRGMGGLSAAYYDYQSINFINPASIGNLSSTIFDIGGDISLRTLKSNTTPQKYTSTNTNISYVQLGLNLGSKKMSAKKMGLGVVLGLRPLTNVGYKVNENKRLAGIDSVSTLYEGSGGMNLASLSAGFRIKNFSIGLTGGYAFGNKNTSTQLAFNNDTVSYFRSNSTSQVDFGGLYLAAGMQYEFQLQSGKLKLGVYGSMPQSITAKRSTLDETFFPSPSGGTINIDSVDFKTGERGKIKYPSTIGAGFTYTDSLSHWTFGADFETSNWAEYRLFEQKDQLQNSFRIKAGAQYYPAKANTPASKYFSFVKYRAGVFFGTDPIKVENSRSEYGLTLGAGFPLTSFNRIRYGEYSFLNTAVEVGTRGNKSTGSIREGLFRFSIGISMNARWFQKRKYD